MFRFKSSIRREYEILRLIVLTFLGGMLSTMTIQSLMAYYLTLVAQHFTWQAAITFLLVAVFIYATPTLLSFAFILLQRDWRLVPPLYIGSVAFILLLFLDRQSSVILPFGGFTAIASLVGDRIVVGSVGRNAPRDQIATYSLRVLADANRMRDILTQSRYTGVLWLRRKVEDTKRGFLFKRRRSIVQGVIELERGKNSETFVNIALYRVWNYWIEKTEGTEESLRLDVAYLKDILQRQEPPVPFEDASPNHCDHIVDDIIYEMMGIYMRAQNTARGKWLALAVTIMLWIVSTIVVAEGFGIADILAAIGIAVYATYATREYFKED